MSEWSAERQERERQFWRRVPRGRPSASELVSPGPGEESVWDYPRPPRVEPVTKRVRVEHAGRVLADTTSALRVLETASPPVYYIPPDDICRKYLEGSRHQTFCEWKGIATFWSIRVDGAFVLNAAWCYPQPDRGFERIRDHFAFFAGLVDACWVGDARAQPQPGGFYGGWVTPDIVGPFKGDPGTEGW